MAEWYMRDPHEQQRLSRILDVAQDLKVRIRIANANNDAKYEKQSVVHALKLTIES